MWIKQLAPSIFSVMVQSFCRRGILGKLGKGGKDMVVKGEVILECQTPRLSRKYQCLFPEEEALGGLMGALHEE